jgi:hypothetical protein
MYPEKGDTSMPITSINKRVDPADANIGVSASRQNGADVRQKAKPWEALGISRATWYRYGKPTDKAVYDDLRWEKQGACGTLADCDFLKNRFGSIRSYQRAMRVHNSELWPYAEHGIVSIAEADRILGNPHALRRFREWAAEQLASVKAVENALKLFEQERRNDVSAEAIAAYLNKPVAFVAEVLSRDAMARALGDAP